MAGYWNRPEDTAAVIDADGWFRTGDIAYLDGEGFLTICDRSKDMIISGGENVYPAEVESVLFKHPAIAGSPSSANPTEMGRVRRRGHGAEAWAVAHSRGVARLRRRVAGALQAAPPLGDYERAAAEYCWKSAQIRIAQGNRPHVGSGAVNIEVRAPARPALNPFYRPEHEAFRETVRRFVKKEIEPFATQWDEAEEFPRELYRKAAAIGLLQLGFPEAYGGIACDRFMRLVASQGLARCGAGGICASLMSHTIGAPPIARRGSEEMKRRVLPEILSGEKISALAITESGGGPTWRACKRARGATATIMW